MRARCTGAPGLWNQLPNLPSVVGQDRGEDQEELRRSGEQGGDTGKD